MKTVSIEIKGVSPLLINRFTEAAENPETSRKGKKDYGTPRAQAEKTAYCDDKTKILWVPSTWIKGSVQSIASDYKLIGTRKSIKSVSGGAILPLEEKLYFNEKYTIKDIEIDSRPVVIMRARIMRHRARLEKWTILATFEIDEELVDAETFNKLLTDAGRRAGIGDFRAQKGGSFGRFVVSKFKVN